MFPQGIRVDDVEFSTGYSDQRQRKQELSRHLACTEIAHGILPEA